MKLVLEARHLFDGSLHAVAKHATDLVDHDRLHHTDPVQPAESHSDPAPTAAAVSYADVPALAPNPTASEILFVDPRVANWQSLASSVKSDVQVVLIDPTKDGIDQVTAALQGRSDLTSIQFLTYGQPGQLELGSSAVTTASLSSHATEVASWGDHLAAGGDIEFWGCDVAEGSSGQAFVDTVHTLTGATVGASTDATGASTLGGNWVLEDATGPLHGAVFSATAMADYQYILDTAVPSVTLSAGTGSLTGNTTGDVLLGDSFTETATFTNATTGTQAGFGPIIELFVPTATATDTETATLNNATYLGSAVTQHALTLVNNAGHIGAFDPYVLDTSGNATFIVAPTGFKVGDTMYDLILPFGSFTQGQPTADIQLNFTSLDATSVLTSHTGAHPGSTLDIAATGVFEFGNDALNNPSTDPSIVGATVTSTTTVSLLNVTATTDLHEDETATGPNNPFNYVITIVPAPVVSTNAISGASLTFTIPDAVDYSGGTIAVTGTGTGGDSGSFSGTLNTPGGTVTVSLPALTHTTTIEIPVYVPEKDSSGTTILTSGNGYQAAISTNPNYTYSGTWTPLAGSLAFSDGAEAISGSGADAVTFTAKALAIQVTDSDGGSAGGNGTLTLPSNAGSEVTESINFQVSDYVSLSNLVIKDVLGDGFTLDPSFTPTLTVNNPTSANSTLNVDFGAAGSQTTDTPVAGETVALAGTGLHWNYSRNDTAGDGTTAINFMVGALLADSAVAALQGHLSAATSGTITFKVKTLDKYTETNSEGSLRELDTATNTVTTTGTSADVTATSDSGTTTDDSGLTDIVPMNDLALAVVDVNGVSSDGSSGIKPGDTVTYELTYTLTAGEDFGNLDLTSFLPEPVFSATDPTAVGSTHAFVAGSGLTAGTYSLDTSISGVAISGATANATQNSLSFALGSNNDTSNTVGQTIKIDFAVKAGSSPFADGLFLTNQGNSTNFDAHNSVNAISANAIQQIQLLQPELEIKTGIVSLLPDTGTTAKGTYSSDSSNSTATYTTQTSGTAATTPGAQFEPAGTAAGTDPLVPGATSTSPLPFTDLNVTGADGGDTARVVSTVVNNGHADAFDVTLQGTVPTGYTAGSVTHFAIYDSAGTQIDNTVTAAQYFAAGGIKLANSIAAGSTIYVVYDLPIAATQSVGTTLTANGAIVNWANVAGGVAAGQGFVSGTNVVGAIAADLSDNATIGVSAPSIDKTVTAGNDTGSTEPVALPTVVLGETVTYQLVLTVPEGDTTNGGGQVTLKDTLPTGTSLVGTPTITYDANISLTGGPASGSSISANASGQNLTFDLGTAVVNSAHDATDTITITYQAKVSASNTPTNGHAFTNSASLQYDGTSVSGTSATVNELNPNVTETIGVTDDTVSHNAITNIYSGEVLDYTVSLKNANGAAPANGLVYYVAVPTADLTTITSLAATSSGTIVDTGTQVGGNEVLKITLSGLAANTTDTFTFKATVADNLAAGTSVVVDTPTGNALSSTLGGETANGTYNSLPTAVDVGHVYSSSASNTVSVATFSPQIGIIGEANNTSGNGTPLYTTATSGVDATIGDIVRYSAYVQVPEGENATTLTVNLPTGMTFEGVGGTNGDVTILLLSPGGQLTSTNVTDPTAQQSFSGSPNTPLATSIFDPSHVTYNTTANTVTFDLGTLQDNEGVSGANYVLVQFNAIVTNSSTIGTGSGQSHSLAATVQANGGTASSAATVTVEEPKLALTKTVSSIVTSGGVTTVTYSETVKNNGNAEAYDVSLDDPQAGSNVGALNVTSMTGSLTVGGTGSDLTATGNLAAGASEVITYTETVTAPSAGVADTTAKVTYTSLSSASESLSGTTTGTTGSATGQRDGVTAPLTTNDYESQVTLGLGAVSGQVWNDIGPVNSTFGETGSHDTGLSGVTVTGSFTGTGGTVTDTVITAGDGTYTILAPDGSVTVSLPTPGTVGGVPSNETLVYNDGGMTTGGATHTGTASSTTPLTSVNFSYQTPDTAPVISTWGGTFAATTPVVAYTEGTAVALSTGASVADTEIDETSQNYAGSVLTVERYSAANTTAANAADIFVGTGTGSSALVLSGGTVTYGGTGVGTYTESGGVLKITFTESTTTAATVNNVLNAIGYQGTDSNGFTTGIKIGATLDDHNQSNLQGTGGDMTSAPVFVRVNEQPGAAAVTFTEPNDATASLSAVNLAGTVTVSSSDVFSSVTVKITGGYVSGEDILESTGSLPTGVIATLNLAGDTVTFTRTSGGTTLSASDVQTALRTVQYYDSSDTPTTAGRTVTITLNDSTTSSALTSTTALTVVAANDSPILHDNPVSLGNATENSGAPIDGTTVGTFISALTGNGSAGSNVTDVDNAGLDNTSTVPTGAGGIAITAADTSKGSWYYSLDNGATWVLFADATHVISATNALHLLDSAEIYFAPTAGANGVIDAALTFHAWDQFDTTIDGTIVNGSLSALPSGLGSGTNTLGSAYSSATQTLPLVITAVGGNTFTDPNDDTAANHAVAVDPTVVVSTTDTFSSVTLQLSGSHSEDVLNFTAGNDFTVTSFSGGLLTLTATDGHATAAELQAALQSVTFDDTSDTPFTGSRTVTITAHDNTQGNRVIAAPTVTVDSANDSPILTLDPTLTLTHNPAEGVTAAPTDATTTGTLVSDLLNGRVTDTDNAGLDNTTSAPPSGAIGIVITAADTTEGNWYYNIGAGWVEFAGTGIATPLSNANALHLTSTAQIYFQPVGATTNGLVADALTYRAWDQFDGVANGVLSNIGSTFATAAASNSAGTAYSANAQTLAVNITATGGATYTEVNGADTGTAAVVVDPSTVLANDVYTSATVAISNFQPEDHLLFTNTGGITGSYDSSTGILTLTSTSGATGAQMQAALDSVTYFDSSDKPITTTRNVTIGAHDSSTGMDVTVTSTTISITPANDSPVLTPVGGESFATATETATATPPSSGTVGTLVSSLISGSNITDTDGANAHDGATPGAIGIAITQADTTAGTWWYSTNGGTSWTEFAGTGTAGTTLNGSNALHLLPTAMVYFEPASGANGTVDTALTFRAWDQFDTTLNSGVTNGAVTALPTDGIAGALGTGTNTQASAYSANQQVLSLAITGSQTVTYTDPNTDPNGTNLASSALVADAGLVLTTSDAITSATVTLSGGHAEDMLTFANDGLTMGNITGSYASGVLTLSSAGSSATAAQFQAAIDAVKFYDTSDTPITGNRTVTIAVADATTATTRTISSTTVTVDAANDSPVLTPNPSLTLATASENGPAPTGAVGTLVSALIGGVTDTDGADAHDGATPGLLGIAITQADTTEGTWYYSTDNGAHWTAFAGTGITAISDTNALHLVADANTRIFFQSTASGQSSTVDTALTFHGWDQFDGAANGSLAALPTDSALGAGTNTLASAYSSAVQTLPLTITSTAVSTFNDPNDTSASASAVAVNSGLILTSGDTFSGATVQITGNFQPGEDVLKAASLGVFTPGTFDSTTGTLTFTGTGTAAQLQAALQAVTFYDSSDVPATAVTRTITITGHDATTGTDRTLSISTATVTAANDSPVLNGTSVSLAHATEDGGAPVGAVGTLVSALTGNGNVTDTDGADAHDGATPGLLGIAITQADTTEGTWYYTTDNGAHWTAFAGTGIPAISDTNALHLVADANTRIYFDPSPNWNGAIPNALTIRGWDQFDGAANGSLSALPTDGALGAGVNTHSSAYSATTQTLPLIGDPVNDAPIANGSAVLTATTEDTSNPPGDTVAHLFVGNFSDTTDQQQTTVNPTGSVANTLAGIAITGNAATAGQGVWQYSTDNGAHWTSLPDTGLSDSNAIVLPQSAELRFLPDANFNGVPGGLTTRLIDSSTQTVTAGVTGLALSTGTTAYTGVDVSGTNDGGITAVSAATVPLNTSVTAVNDAPIASGTATVPSTPEDTGSPAGTSIGSLLGQSTVNYSDATDTVTTAVSGGSTGTPSAGIAITGNSATAAQGTYQYSTDDGATWVSIPTSGLGDTNAIVLPNSAELRFVPVANYNGVVGSLTAHVSDGTNLPTAGAQDISAVEGGTGGFSAGTITIGTSVTAVNDAPIATGSATLAGVSQDAHNIPGDTVSHLFSGNFSDTADQQQTATNPTGSVANTLAGIVITGNAAAGQGTYEYSTDGVNWVAVPTNVSDSNAIIVPVTGSIRFVPNDTFHGTPGGLTVHLIDSSSGALTQISTGVDATNVGGTTAISLAPVVLTTTVTEGGGNAILTPPATVDPSLSTSTTSSSTTVVDQPPTDDLGTPPAANHSATTDDFLERPIIPQVSLIGSVGNKFVLAEQQAIIAIPSNLFEDSYPGAQLEFDARNPAGGALPSWLEFDARNLTFSGTPPASAHGAVDILIVAKDQFGNEATASFRILVGRESEDLQHLLEPNSPPPEDVGPVTTAPAAPAKGTASGRHADAGVAVHNRQADLHPAAAHGGTVEGMFASLAQPAHTARHGHTAFSAQLRAAGPIGRLSQARQLLDTIAKLATSKPAA